MQPSEQALLVNAALIAATAIVIALGMSLIKLARRQAKGDTSDQPEDLFAQFQEAYDAGEMDTAEFERVRASLDRQKAPPTPRQSARRKAALSAARSVSS